MPFLQFAVPGLIRSRIAVIYVLNQQYDEDYKQGTWKSGIGYKYFSIR